MEEIVENFCGEETIWDYELGWNTTVPRFTRCFQKTVPIWAPSIFLWLFGPIEAYLIVKHRRNCASIPYNPYNIARLTAVLSLLLVNCIQFVYDLLHSPYLPVLQSSDLDRFLSSSTVADLTSSLLYLLTFGLFTFSIILHRLFGVHTSGVAWIFTFLSVVFALPNLYMFALFHGYDDENGPSNSTSVVEALKESNWYQNSQYQDTFQFAIFSLHFALLLVVFLLTCFADRRPPSCLHPSSSSLDDPPTKESNNLIVNSNERDDLVANSFELKNNSKNRKQLTEQIGGEEQEDDVQVYQQLVEPLINGQRQMSGDSSATTTTSTVDSAVPKDSSELRASFLSSITYWWFNSMAVTGFRKSLTLEDLWKLKHEDTTAQCAPKFDRNWQRQFGGAAAVGSAEISVDSSKVPQSNGFQSNSAAVVVVGAGDRQSTKKPGTLTAMFHTYGLYFISGASLKLLHDLLQFVSPQLLKIFIEFVSKSSAVEPIWHGFFIAILFFLVSTTQSILLNQYFYIMYQIGMRIRTSLTSAIYRKALNLSNLSRRETTTGEIINLMSVDAQRFVELIPFVNLMWSAPLQILLTVYFLWMELGPAVLAGLGVMVLMIPLNGVISTYQRRLQIKQMKLKDERVKVINELLNGMRVIKLYAWEIPFIRKVNDIRNTELQNLKYIAYISSVTSFLWTCTPFLVSFVSFAIYVLSSEQNILDAKKAFVSLSLFNLLRFPLTMLPQMITSVVTASVSIKRLNRFLNSTQLEKYVKRDEEMADNSIVIQDGTFCWEMTTTSSSDTSTDNQKSKTKNGKSKNKGDDVEKKLLDHHNNAAGSNGNELNGNASASASASSSFALNSINLTVKKGSLVAIVGHVGSGKSSLLSAILGDMERLSGTVSVNGSSSMAYVAQQAWIQNATLRENILFGRKFVKDRYRKIIEMCALEPDIAILPGGDTTEIGEKGINLSGGQKQRVAIARACYADSDIVLFDDPLSAVDSHVAQHIFSKVISTTTGYLSNRTRVLVTNNISLLPDVDQIVVLSNGRISEIGTYQQLMKNSGKFSDFVKEFSAENKNENKNTELNDDSLTSSVPKSPENELLRMRSVSLRSKSDSFSQEQQANQKKKKSVDSEVHTNKLIETEHTETGGVKFSIYMSYFRSLTFLWMSLVTVGFIGMQVASVFSNVWLAMWSNDPIPSANITEQEISLRNHRLAIYGSLGITQALFVLLGAFALARGTVHSSGTLHRQLLERIMRSPMQFFDTTPLGRIVNRFSKDIDTIDSTIPHTIRGWLLCFLQVIATFILISIEVPIFFMVVLPILLLYYFIQKFYVATSRQLKRLESVTRSPIYSHFGETLSGVSTIRAYGSADRFVLESNHRVDTNQRCYFPSVISNRWLAVRLEFCGNFIVFFAAVFSVLSRDSFQSQPGFVGLIITYALGVTQTLNWLVRMSSEIETNIVSVERIGEYCENETEREWTRPEGSEPALPESWPQQGVIKFDKYSVRYRNGLQLVLNGITIEVNSGEKIGIVGRTGAGKSSLTLSLFRLLEAAKGRIVIDNVDISQIGLHELRNKLSIIPQDPILFSGTIRSNLDPFEINSDDRLWQALEHSHLKEYVSSLDSGLDYRVAENGENLSVGQRQLICLARALLRKTKILILDEATAAIDLETDSLIQTTIRQEFADCTILTIAHRLNTILDSNRVLVLDQGKVAEFDSPERLLKDRRSKFYSLAKDAGIV